MNNTLLNRDQYNILDCTVKYRLVLTDGLSINLYKGKVPNKWYRFWHKIFFGFKWEKVC